MFNDVKVAIVDFKTVWYYAPLEYILDNMGQFFQIYGIMVR